MINIRGDFDRGAVTFSVDDRDVLSLELIELNQNCMEFQPKLLMNIKKALADAQEEGRSQMVKRIQKII